MTSWCDKLASTPAVGFRFVPHFAPSSAIISAFSPIFDKEIEGDRQTFNIEIQDTFGLTFNTERGLQYICNPTTLAITFNHRIKASPSSAGPPRMEMVSKPAPYTDLLESVTAKSIDAALCILNINPRMITRVGIVSATTVDFDDLPPAISDLFDSIGKIIGPEIDSLNITISSIIEKTESHTDRCIHILSRSSGANSLAVVNLDWHRTYSTPRSFNRGSLLTMVGAAKSSALAYFERVGEGGLSDGVYSND